MQSSRETVKWLWETPGRKKGYIAALTAVQAINGATGVFYALLLRNIVDAAASHDGALFWRGVLLIAALVAAQLVLRTVIRYLYELSRSSLENLFKSRLTDVILCRDYLTVSAVHSGEWLNRLTNDAVVVANNCVDIIPGLTGMIVKLVSAIAMMVALEPLFAAVLIPGGAVLTLFTWSFRKKLKRLHKRIQESDGRLRVFLQERIGSLLIIRSYATEEQTRRESAEKMEEHKADRMRRNRFSNLCNFGFGAAMEGMYLLGVVWCGYGILKGTISFGTMTAITQLISQVQSPFANISAYLPKFYAMQASAERLMEAERFPGDEGQPLSRAEAESLYRERLRAFGLHDASFTYYRAGESITQLSKEQMPAALEHIDLEIRKGEYVAFTGHSGCGKSTVLKLLMCVFSPDAGERYYTESAGTMPMGSVHRRLFAYVPQGNMLMNGSIREVVAFADPVAAQDTARLREALRIACAEDFVAELEQGADTMLGERGAGLSEGQMQRLAIARAVFSGAPILLLDEATSSLDAETERRLLVNLRSMTDKTVVIVTHRTAALEICDRVLHFTENGVTET